jgi:xanthine dehydrogenase molybdopterin-binding subunit B
MSRTYRKSERYQKIRQDRKQQAKAKGQRVAFVVALQVGG